MEGGVEGGMGWPGEPMIFLRVLMLAGTLATTTTITSEISHSGSDYLLQNCYVVSMSINLCAEVNAIPSRYPEITHTASSRHLTVVIPRELD